ncbi:MAG: TIGR03960 family B12-binding radical SAM protein [Phycisphaerae bacterium]|nr:TIGR03960 family B12-binding radical SAM protein [Phycisphaerae bacterium]
MKSLAQRIREEFLPKVDRPGQYIGLEINARHAGDVDAFAAAKADGVAVALAFPDTYAIGISHLGSQILYTMLNDTPGCVCDRAYCPTPDAETILRQANLPLFGWESRASLREFDLLGFSLAYELCVTNVLTMLDLAGIPLHAADRGEGDPIVIAGDALADTPEPMADFIDLFLVGDGELPLAALAKLVADMKRSHATRDEILLQAARAIPGIYAPQFYSPRYNADGTLAALTPTHSGLPTRILRSHIASMDQTPPMTAPLVPLAEAVHDRVAVEIMRGCPNGCRFCQAGHARLPVRCRRIDDIVATAQAAIDATGHHEVSLLSLSTSDYPNLSELIDRMTAQFTPQHVSISLPSLRVDSQLRELPRLTSGVRKGGLTIAAEAGSERLRRAIGKDITEDNMLAGVQAAYRAGWRSVKVYFMAGLPGETDADIDEIFDLCQRLSFARKPVDNQRGSISASVSWAVPKPHTPMQWCAMRDATYFWAVRSRLREYAQRTPVSFKFHWIERSLLEAVLCRGDRRVGAAIEAVWRAGARMDSWDEHFNYARWQTAFAETGLDMAFYAHRELPLEELTPWDHIAPHRGREFLLKEYQRMRDVIAEL